MRHQVAADVSANSYDVVIVGAGISGSILAKQLARQGRKVLILEAGTDKAFEYEGYRTNLDSYYMANAKVPNAPYPANGNAPQPDVLDVGSTDPAADSRGYLVQQGPQPFKSDYPRQGGGTTLHWLGTCLRMLPQDFEMRSRYGVGLDWPISYEDLKPYYEMAEREIGVSADVEDQAELMQMLGAGEDYFGPDYVYPMHRIPLSHSDQVFSNRLGDYSIDYDGRPYPLRVTSTPQGRNGMPNKAYPGGYTPVGAVGNPDLGQRCQGNSSCVPICPVQAKYNALKTLSAAVETGNVDVVTQAVASQLKLDGAGRVTEVVYKTYADPKSNAYDVCSANGTVFVLASHVVENVKLLLASGIGSDATGRYLMDHPVLLNWGLIDEVLGTFRGPGSSAGIESVRGGDFRTRRAAFRVEIDNWGWNWAANAPYSTVDTLVHQQGLFGTALRNSLFDQVQRQVRFGFLIEVPPDPANRITIADAYRDRIDNFRPVINFDLPDYTKAGIAEARRTCEQLFGRLNIQDHTVYAESDPGHFQWQGIGYTWQGAGHYIGGHVMGTERSRSVVDSNQKVWDHDNLWLVGCGNMPTEGTSNPTLTMAALTFRAAESIGAALNGGAA
jgi:choline dehydrogenase-like flavoprotein